MIALHDLVKEGLVRYIGMSSCYTWECERLTIFTTRELGLTTISLELVHVMQSMSPVQSASGQQQTLTLDLIDYAITHNLTPFISMQNHHSLIYREEEREMFPTLKVCAYVRLHWLTL